MPTTFHIFVDSDTTMTTTAEPASPSARRPSSYVFDFEDNGNVLIMQFATLADIERTMRGLFELRREARKDAPVDHIRPMSCADREVG